MFDWKIIEEYCEVVKTDGNIPESFLREFKYEFGVSLNSLTYGDRLTFFIHVAEFYDGTKRGMKQDINEFIKKTHKLVDKYKQENIDNLLDDFDFLVAMKEAYENELKDFIYYHKNHLRQIEKDSDYEIAIDEYLFDNAASNKYASQTANDVLIHIVSS